MTGVALVAVINIILHFAMFCVHVSLIVRGTVRAIKRAEVCRSRMTFAAIAPFAIVSTGIYWKVLPVMIPG